jgi:phosphocarrier protein HPr
LSSFHEVDVELTNEQGLHTRPAKLFVESAVKFSADIEVIYNDFVANGKSIMSLLGLLAYKGCILTIRATGDDAHDATTTLKTLIENGFSK